MSSVTAGYKLFTPLAVDAELELKNRIVFSPLTRGRSNAADHTANDLNVQYYEQRAGAGLIISEATAIHPQGFGWYGAPGIYNEAHVASWKKVTDAVHAKNGKIFVQLWHMGRQAHSSFNEDKQIVSASATQLDVGRLRNAKGEYTTYEQARALETEEVAEVVEMYRHAAALAKEAGFDGVEIHGANGYLVDQFLQSVTNHRTDKYGGSVENRARFLLEIVDAVKTVWPDERIGVRLSPNGVFAGMGAADNYEQFVYTAAALSQYKLAYVALLDAHPSWGAHDKGRHVTLFDIKANFKGTVMANVAYTRDSAEGALRSGAADLASFGRLYIANPDLAERFQNDWPLAELPDRSFWWGDHHAAEGYVTFPAYTPAE